MTISSLIFWEWAVHLVSALGRGLGSRKANQIAALSPAAWCTMWADVIVICVTSYAPVTLFTTGAKNGENVFL
jgi:hypothetical protein